MVIDQKNYTIRGVHARCSDTLRRFQSPTRLHSMAFMVENQRDSYTVAVGKRLADARRNASPRITQARAAELFANETGEEISSQAIANYEQGIRLPSPPTVAVLCRIYGTATAPAVLGLEDGPQNMREATLLQKYRLADDRGKYAIDRIADVESPEVSGAQQEDAA